MKKLHILLAILFLGVIACEKEDFGGETTEAIIDSKNAVGEKMITLKL